MVNCKYINLKFMAMFLTNVLSEGFSINNSRLTNEFSCSESIGFKIGHKSLVYRKSRVE